MKIELPSDVVPPLPCGVAVQGVVRWILTKIRIAWHRYRADRNNYWMMRDYWQGLKYCSDFRRERRDYHVAQIERLESKNPPNVALSHADET